MASAGYEGLRTREEDDEEHGLLVSPSAFDEPTPIAARGSRTPRLKMQGRLGRALHLRAVRVGLVFATLVLLGLVVQWCVVYNRGYQAAQAAIAELDGSMDAELDNLLDDDGSASGGSVSADALAEKLADRAGRGSMPQARPQNTPEEWAEKAAGDSAVPAEDIELERIPQLLASPGKASDAHWGEVWMMDEINQALSAKIEEMNANMSTLMQGKTADAQLPKTDQMIVDSFDGAETLHIDEANCYDVKSDLDTGIARIFIKVVLHTEMMDIRGRFRPGKKGEFFAFKLLVYGFSAQEDSLEGDFRYEDRTVPSAKVGWVKANYNRMDGTCYQKKHPDRRDNFCTKVMNKALRKKRGMILHKLSAKLTKGLQEKIDSMLPYKLGNKKDGMEETDEEEEDDE